MGLKRPLFWFFLPQTGASRLRTLNVWAPYFAFIIAANAILIKQMYFRTHLDDEDEATHDRIERRGYVALPDGTMALVHPRVDVRTTLPNLWNSVVEACSLMP